MEEEVPSLIPPKRKREGKEDDKPAAAKKKKVKRTTRFPGIVRRTLRVYQRIIQAGPEHPVLTAGDLGGPVDVTCCMKPEVGKRGVFISGGNGMHLLSRHSEESPSSGSRLHLVQLFWENGGRQAINVVNPYTHQLPIHSRCGGRFLADVLHCQIQQWKDTRVISIDFTKSFVFYTIVKNAIDLFREIPEFWMDVIQQMPSTAYTIQFVDSLQMCISALPRQAVFLLLQRIPTNLSAAIQYCAKALQGGPAQPTNLQSPQSGNCYLWFNAYSMGFQQQEMLEFMTRLPLGETFSPLWRVEDAIPATRDANGKHPPLWNMYYPQQKLSRRMIQAREIFRWQCHTRILEVLNVENSLPIRDLVLLITDFVGLTPSRADLGMCSMNCYCYLS